MATFRKALLVGINHYPSKPLNYCIKDAKAMRQALSKHHDGKPNFACEVLVSSETNTITQAILTNRIKKLFSDEAEAALFYFSGHGFVNDLGGYLVTQEAIQDDPGMPINNIVELASRSRSKEKIIILDCCYSGIIGNVFDKLSAFLPKGTVILSASSEDQQAVEGYGGGLFTSIVVDGLEGGAADILGYVTIDAIYYRASMLLGPWDQRPIFKSYLSSLSILRKCQPKVELEVLRQLPLYFETPDCEHRLSPAYEPDAEPRDLQKEQIFGHLQKMTAIGLVKPVGEEHMYYAAMNNRSCALTPLGKFYWKLAANGRI